MPPGTQPTDLCESWQAGFHSSRPDLWPQEHGEPRLSHEAVSMLRHVDAFARTHSAGTISGDSLKCGSLFNNAAAAKG